jgi:hypothetical protein
MAALWSEATVEERRDMVMLILGQGGLLCWLLGISVLEC